MPTIKGPIKVIENGKVNPKIVAIVREMLPFKETKKDEKEAA